MRRCAWILLVVCAGAGCSQGPAHPELIVTRGAATLDGKPLDGALLIFHPADAGGAASVKGRARVTAEGTFTVETYVRGDGLRAGNYVVTVDWRKPAAEDGNEPPNLAPARYAAVESSPLKIQVVPGPDGACELPPLRLTR